MKTKTKTRAGARLTSKEAARLLGVSEASVKRWADGGLLRAEKTAGGHRRFRPEDVAVFRRGGLQETGRPAARVGLLTAARTRPAKRRSPLRDKEVSAAMFGALSDGHSEEAAAILLRLHAEGRGVASLADELVCPSMRRVGELWQHGEMSVAGEHIATSAVMEALFALRVVMRPVPTHGRTALCCASEDDFHDLPARLAALTLEELGWEVLSLGASTPFFALAEATERFSPRLVCVSSTILSGLDRAAREYADLRRATSRAGASVVLGGAGFGAKDVRRRFPAELHAGSFLQLEEFALSLEAGE